jgi:predicted adenylyl cyclase CyaB
VNNNNQHFEIERKFRLSNEEYELIQDRLKEMCFVLMRSVIERDIFFPVEKQGDMLRLREQECEGTITYFLTRKTWIDAGGEKERSETECEISEFVSQFILAAAHGLNPKELRNLTKERSFFENKIDKHRKVTVALDNVRGLEKRSGPYVEIELIIEHEEDVQSARDEIASLAKSLLREERASERLSYQDMLVEALAQS